MVACVTLKSATSGVEPGPLASEASVLLLGHLSSKTRQGLNGEAELHVAGLYAINYCITLVAI